VNDLISHITDFQMESNSALFHLVLKTAFSANASTWYNARRSLITDIDSLRQEYCRHFLRQFTGSDNSRDLYMWWSGLKPSVNQSLVDFALQQKLIYETSNLALASDNEYSLTNMIIKQLPSHVKVTCAINQQQPWEQFLSFLYIYDSENISVPSSSSSFTKKTYNCSKCGPNPTHIDKDCFTLHPELRRRSQKQEVVQVNKADGRENRNSSNVKLTDWAEIFCDFCQVLGHPESECFKKHPCETCKGRHRTDRCNRDENSKTFHSEKAKEWRARNPDKKVLKFKPKGSKNE